MERGALAVAAEVVGVPVEAVEVERRVEHSLQVSESLGFLAARAEL